MTVFLGILTFVLVLAVLILVHELGHFTFAKLMGVRVEEFGLGFPPRVKSWRRGDTVYSLNAIPIGGFVKMLGENGDDVEPDSFGAKPPWQRLIILAAGASMNLLLAVVISFFVFLHGSPVFQDSTAIAKVAPNSPAAAAHLEKGDQILTIDGQAVHSYRALANVIGKHLGQRVKLTVQRGSGSFTTGLVPRVHPPKNQGPMGIQLGQIRTVTYSPQEAAGRAVGQIGSMVAAIPTFFSSVSHNGGSGLTGPIGIAHITTDVVQNAPQDGGIDSILGFVAFLSLNLGVLNLLPIPALDGGRIVFVLISWIRRRNLDPEVEGLIHMVGMAILLTLIVLISYHDIIRWVGGGSF